MEGLIPFVYRAIVQYRNDGRISFTNSLFNESPSTSYVRLPGDSGRFHSTEIEFFSSSSATAAPLTMSTTQQSPLRRSTSRRHA